MRIVVGGVCCDVDDMRKTTKMYEIAMFARCPSPDKITSSTRSPGFLLIPVRHIPTNLSLAQPKETNKKGRIGTKKQI